MTGARDGTVSDLATPAAVIDLDRMEANLDRMADYARTRGLALRPHIKTHKTPALAAAQLRRGAAGVTVATARELRAMGDVADDILLAYPTVAGGRLDAARSLAGTTRLTVALDSAEAARALADAMRDAGREADVLVEIDVGMRRCGVTAPSAAVRLATLIAELDGLRFRGVMFYPGHIRDPVRDQDAALEALSAELATFVDALGQAGHDVAVVSGGSTPTAYRSHEIAGVTEIRPGTYIFNDRTTAAVGGCAWDDCAYTIHATVVSTAVPGQAVVDAGSKSLSREELRAPGARFPLDDERTAPAGGLGALLERPEVVVRATSEEHGILDLSDTDWRPRVGERVRIVPNHVCVSVNLQPVLVGCRDGRVVESWPVTARGWD